MCYTSIRVCMGSERASWLRKLSARPHDLIENALGAAACMGLTDLITLQLQSRVEEDLLDAWSSSVCLSFCSVRSSLTCTY